MLSRMQYFKLTLADIHNWQVKGQARAFVRRLEEKSSSWSDILSEIYYRPYFESLDAFKDGYLS